MATPPDSSNSKKVHAAAKNPQTPPDERFWKRYSPHHEFSISSSSSAVLHVLGLGILVIGGIVLARFGFAERPVEVSPIVIAGGGGLKDGTPGPKTGTGNENEVINETKPEELAKTEPPKEAFKPPDKEVKPILPPPDQQTAKRPIEDNSSNLLSISQNAREQLNSRIARGNASQGKGGPGEGGGKGSGKGTGEGNLAGPGKINVSQREKRQLRWEMQFRTLDGNDYLRQLKSLNAILAIDGPSGELLVIEDLMRRPAVPVAKDFEGINRIYWTDDRPESVNGLAHALQLPNVPSRFIAFFPVELENELLKKELAFRNLPEEEIDKTWFKIVPTRRGFEPFVERQTKIGRHR
jgi:hypothetical protein